MRKRVTLVPEAVADVAEAYIWYEEQAVGLGDQFLECLEATYALVAEQPLIYPIRFDSFRRVLLRRFPYAVYYDFDDTAVHIHYVFHCSQSLGKLRQRLRTEGLTAD